MLKNKDNLISPTRKKSLISQ